MEQATHLVVLVHGLLGSEYDFHHFALLLEQHLSGQPFNVYVHVAECNASGFFATYDGVDAGGERLAKEIQQLTKMIPQLTKFSIIGHSLGGLYSRYAVGLLFSQGFFNRVIPMNFITLATPHLGILRPQRGGFNALYNALSPALFSKTSTQLSLRDVPSDLTLQLANRSRQGWKPQDSHVLMHMKGRLRVQLLEPAAGTTKSMVSIGNGPFDVMEAELADQQLRLYQVALYEDAAGNQQEPVQDQQKPLVTLDLMELRAKVVLPALIPVAKQTSLRDLFTKTKTNSHMNRPIPKEESAQQHLYHSTSSVEENPCSARGPSSSWTRSTNAVDVCLRDSKQQCVAVLRFGCHELAAKWKWLAAIANSCLGAVDCVVDGQPQDQQSEEKSSDPNCTTLQCLSEGQFLQALSLFKFRSLYGNVFCDLNVSYTGACLRAYNPYRSHQLVVELSPAYCHIMTNSIDNSCFRRTTKRSEYHRQLSSAPKVRSNVSSWGCSSGDDTNATIASICETNEQDEQEPEQVSQPPTQPATEVAMDLGEKLLNMFAGIGFSQSDGDIKQETPNSHAAASPQTRGQSDSGTTSLPPSKNNRQFKSISMQDGSTPQSPSFSPSPKGLRQSHTLPSRDHSKKQYHHHHRPHHHHGSHGDDERPLPFVAKDDNKLLLDQLDEAFCSVRSRDLLRTMLLRLQSVGWQRVDVLIESVMAHEKIIAKRTNPTKPHENGVDIVHHVMDTMLL